MSEKEIPSTLRGAIRYAIGVLIILFIGVLIILLIGPYIPGADFGFFKVPAFESRTAHILQIIGIGLFAILAIIICVSYSRSRRKKYVILKDQLSSFFSSVEQNLDRYLKNKNLYYGYVIEPLGTRLGVGGMVVPLLDESFKGKTIEELLYGLTTESTGKRKSLGESLKQIRSQLLQLDHKAADDDMNQRKELFDKAQNLVGEAKRLVSES